MDLKRYPLPELMTAIGVKGKAKQFIFLLLLRRELKETQINYGMTLTDFDKAIETLTPTQKQFFKIKKLK